MNTLSSAGCLQPSAHPLQWRDLVRFFAATLSDGVRDSAEPSVGLALDEEAPENSQRSRESRFLELLRRNQQRIERLCFSWSRSPAEREDLLSEVYLQLWRSIDSYQGRAKEDTWLYRLALNTVMYQRRGIGRREAKTEELETAPVEPTDQSRSNALDSLLERERRERLARALQQLPRVDRALMTLWLEELPYREISRITGLSESNVGVRVHRLRSRLEALLGEVDPHPASESE